MKRSNSPIWFLAEAVGLFDIRWCSLVRDEDTPVVCHDQICEQLSAIMFLLYGDESLDETQSRVCAVGGLVGEERAWNDIESKWKNLHGAIPFHANQCESDHGDYAPKSSENADAKHKANQELYKASTTLLAESGIGGFAAAYDLAAQREAFPPPHAVPLYYQPFLDVIQAMLNFADSRERRIAKLTFDSRLESEHNAGLVYANLREENPVWQERLAEEISFVSSRTNVRIQIADLFAREAMKLLDNIVGPVKGPFRKSWEALRDTGRFAVILRDANYFKSVERDLKRFLNFDISDFGVWLSARNRQWSLTAYFEFLLEHVKQMTPAEKQAFEHFLGKY